MGEGGAGPSGGPQQAVALDNDEPAEADVTVRRVASLYRPQRGHRFALACPEADLGDTLLQSPRQGHPLPEPTQEPEAA